MEPKNKRPKNDKQEELKETPVILGLEKTINTQDQYSEPLSQQIANQPISLDNIEWWNHRNKRLVRDCNALFERLKMEYNKQTVLFPRKNVWRETSINLAKKHIEEIKRLFEKSTRNGLPPEKIPRSIELLPAYEDFLKWLEKEDKEEPNLVIKEEYIGLIYDEFHDAFPEETKEQWQQRFNIQNKAITAMKLSKEAREGTNRLKLLAILAAIQERTKNSFPFDKFVLARFGVKGYYKVKSIHQEDASFKETFKICRAILRK